MAIEEMFTELPTVSTAQMSDIICAVQGYVSPSVLGLSVQETLQQVFNLFQETIILSYPGNPNGFVAGTTYQLLWDTVDLVLWVCTTTGTATVAVWTEVISSASNWIDQSSTPVTLIANYKYVSDNGSTQTVYTLPLLASFGTIIRVGCKSSSTGGWKILENTGQTIYWGNLQTTTTSGSLTSTSSGDFVELLCTTANTAWNVISAIGSITIA